MATKKQRFIEAFLKTADEYESESGHYRDMEYCKICKISFENCEFCPQNILNNVLGCSDMITYNNGSEIDGCYNLIKSPIRAEFLRKAAKLLEKYPEKEFTSKRTIVSFKKLWDLDKRLAKKYKLN